jgi:thymidine kinase
MEKSAVKKGRLEVVCGSMFSGKSEDLIRRLKRSKIAQKKVIVFKHSFDDRTTLDHVASHDGNTIEAIAVENPSQIALQTPADIQVVGIDEAQFFSHELITVVLDLVDSGKLVIIAGLNLDYRGVPFGPMPTLIAMADRVTKLSAVCIVCGDDAYFSQRIINGNPAKYDDPIIQVGAQECYEARCRNCFVMDKKPLWQKTL